MKTLLKLSLFIFSLSTVLTPFLEASEEETPPSLPPLVLPRTPSPTSDKAKTSPMQTHAFHKLPPLKPRMPAPRRRITVPFSGIPPLPSQTKGSSTARGTFTYYKSAITQPQAPTQPAPTQRYNLRRYSSTADPKQKLYDEAHLTIAKIQAFTQNTDQTSEVLEAQIIEELKAYAHKLQPHIDPLMAHEAWMWLLPAVIGQPVLKDLKPVDKLSSFIQKLVQLHPYFGPFEGILKYRLIRHKSPELKQIFIILFPHLKDNIGSLELK